MKDNPDEILQHPAAKELIDERDALIREMEKMKGELQGDIRADVKSQHQARLDGLINQARKIEQNIMKLEKEKRQLKYNLEYEILSKIDETLRKIEKYESVLNNADAFETYMKTNFYQSYQKALSQQNVETGMIMLDERLNVSDKIKEIAKFLRQSFDEMGEAEVAAGKLEREQFEYMRDHYMPRIISEDFKRYKESHKLTDEEKNFLTEDMGFGLVGNKHGKESKTKFATIEEINASKYWKDKLGGKNLFSENVADIYITRAMDNLNLMYDDKYMRTMMKMFGEEILPGEKIEKGFKAVMNYGMAREMFNNMTSMRMSLLISDEIGSFLRGIGRETLEQMSDREINILVEDFM